MDLSEWGKLQVVDIFDEVDEDVRRERLNLIAKKYGPFLGAAVALVIGAVAVFTFWQQHQEARSADAGAGFLAAVRQEVLTPGSSASSFAKVIEEGPDGYGVIARIKQAEALAASGDRSGAIQILEATSAEDAPQRYKILAQLLSISLKSYDEKPEVLLALVEPMTVSGHPWRIFAVELAAALEWKLGQVDDARKRLTYLSSDVSVPASMRARAEMALNGLPRN